jgi:hypothetical protein
MNAHHDAESGSGTPPDAKAPWLGLRPYEERDAELYFGRWEEVNKLYHLARSHRATLLYGPSGSGKTSLLRAGLLVRQREEDALPVYVRFDLSATAGPLAGQVKLAIAAAAEDAEIRGPRPREEETLWEYLHRADGWFWTRGHRIAMPFLVLDQFEEVLASSDSGHLQRDAFLAELADLTEDRTPAAVRRRFEGDPSMGQWFTPARHHYKIVVCTRDDSEGELDRVRDLVSPKLLQNGYRLEPLRGDQAKAAVLGPGAGLVEDDVAEGIVRKAAGGATGRLTLHELQVEPSALSVLCMRLDETRVRQGGHEITKAIVDMFGSEVLFEFFADSLRASTGLPTGPGQSAGPWERLVHERRLQHAQRTLESRLLSDSDRRRSVDSVELGASDGLSDQTVDELVARDILTRSTSDGQESLTLAHDALVRPLRQSGRAEAWRWILRLRDLALWGALLAALLGFGVGVPLGKWWGETSVVADQAAAYRAYLLLDTLNAAKDSVYLAASAVSEAAESLTPEDAAVVVTALAGADLHLSHVSRAALCDAAGGPGNTGGGKPGIVELVCENTRILETQSGLVISARGLAGAQDTLLLRGFYELTREFDVNVDSINAALEEMAGGGA